MSALLLGGAGFIGLHLARRLVNDGHDIMIVDDFSRGKEDPDFAELAARPGVRVQPGDLTDPQTWAALPHDFDQVCLLAAVVGVRNVERDPMRVLRINAQTALHLANWATPKERIFFASTSEVYAGGVNANLVPVPSAETVPVHIADVGAPRFSYAISKLLGEATFLHATAAGQMSAVVGRFHNVYGPRMGADHVIGEMAVRALGGENPFVVPGADQYRAFCYVDDAVEAIVRLMNTPEAFGRIVHIGDDASETNIADLAKLVLRVCEVSPEIQAAVAPAGAVTRRCPDLSVLRQLTGYEPAVTLEEGVQRTVDWCRRRQ
jgi:UDP-glucose 4-epimerase/UDP-glucuronate decarboxylase